MLVRCRNSFVFGLSCMRAAKYANVCRARTKLSLRTPDQHIGAFSLQSISQRCWNTSTYRSYSDDVQIRSESKMKLRYLYVSTCEELWEEFPQGVVFDVGYLDSHPGCHFDPKVPVVLVLHDSPGSHLDLMQIIDPLSKLGYRVIAPNFPGFGFTAGVMKSHDDIFLHSTDERAGLIADLLTELGVKKVDVLLGFRAGCYPAVRLSTRAPDVFRSLVLVSPSGHKPYRGIKPIQFYNTISLLWDRPFLRPAMWLFLNVWKLQSPTFKRLPVNQLISTFHTYKNIGLEEFGGFLVMVDEKKIPCCMVYSESDPHVETDVSEEFADLLGKVSDDFLRFDKEQQYRNIENNPSELPKSIIFEKGVVDPVKEQPGLIAKLVLDLMGFIRKKS